jgi:hypothetical protein
MVRDLHVPLSLIDERYRSRVNALRRAETQFNRTLEADTHARLRHERMERDSKAQQDRDRADMEASIHAEAHRLRSQRERKHRKKCTKLAKRRAKVTAHVQAERDGIEASIGVQVLEMRGRLANAKVAADGLEQEQTQTGLVAEREDRALAAGEVAYYH